MRKCVVSGSFRKHYDSITGTISDLDNAGIRVLSPKKSEIVNPGDDFVFLKSDASTDMKALELQHLEAIRKADFLYVSNPGAYLGTSTLLEIGFALACNKKVFCSEHPADPVINSLISGVIQSRNFKYETDQK